MVLETAAKEGFSTYPLDNRNKRTILRNRSRISGAHEAQYEMESYVRISDGKDAQWDSSSDSWCCGNRGIIEVESSRRPKRHTKRQPE